MNWKSSLAKWRSVRKITKPQTNYLVMMSEEVDEYAAAVSNNDWVEKVDAICDQLVLTTNQAVLEEVSAEVGAFYNVKDCLDRYQFGNDNSQYLNRISEICLDELYSLGVVPALAMKECLKEISSRKIDPLLEADWLEGKLDKWPKWKQQPDTYKANYKLAKRKQYSS